MVLNTTQPNLNYLLNMCQICHKQFMQNVSQQIKIFLYAAKISKYPSLYILHIYSKNPNLCFREHHQKWHKIYGMRITHSKKMWITI